MKCWNPKQNICCKFCQILRAHIFIFLYQFPTFLFYQLQARLLNSCIVLSHLLISIQLETAIYSYDKALNYSLSILTCGSPRFFARMLTFDGSACSIRPYSSQCSLSSAHM